MSDYRGSVHAFISRTGGVCERLEKDMPSAAALIRQQAREMDELWDRLSRAYALVRRESPAEMIQEEMEALRLCSTSDSNQDERLKPFKVRCKD